MKNKHNNPLLQLILATILIAISGPIGKHIDLPTPVIIWWRCALSSIFLFAFCVYKKYPVKLKSKKDLPTIIIGGVLLGIHWITYFYALKLSNVALGMLSLFTFPVITALLEPLFTKNKLNPIHIILGLLVLLGIYILAPEFNFENTFIKGVLCGLVSAVCYALRNLLLKRHIEQYHGISLMFQQTLIVTIILFPVLFFMNTSNIATQYPYILILALLVTAIGHSLLTNSFKYFSVSTASIITSLQPIFGIIMAYFFLNEIPTLNTFYGGSLILITVVIESIRSKKN